MADFGEQLRRWRDAANLTQAEVAAQIGVSNTYISALESGRKPAPPYALVSALAACLGVDEGVLWGVAQAEREERLRQRIQGVPTSLRRRREASLPEAPASVDPLEASWRALSQSVKTPESRRRLADALDHLARSLRKENP